MTTGIEPRICGVKTIFTICRRSSEAAEVTKLKISIYCLNTQNLGRYAIDFKTS